ncbi:MAG: hypothetical protein KBT34_11040 [Prevotella sp.]|nr:hypothetical protein [Candidatus Prevotella equi]
MARTYAKPLLNLDKGMRLEIMHILLDSINTSDASDNNTQPDLFTCFKGSWGEGQNPEEYCKELREGIGIPKEVESW